jgi:hypothetical protein
MKKSFSAMPTVIRALSHLSTRVVMRTTKFMGVTMSVSAHQFITDFMPKIPGWLAPNACYTTECLILSQKDLGVTGTNVEIGVWRGKYLALICACSPERPAFGFDVLLHNQLDDILATVKNVSPETSLQIHRINSFDISPEAFSQFFTESKIAFASVDGSHEAEGVHKDLFLIEQNLAKGGIIAIDDYLNPLTMGVTEGVTLYLQNSTLMPICYSANKLFVTTHGWADLYQIRLRMWLESGAAKTLMNTDLPNWADKTSTLFGKSLLVLA